MVDFRDLAPRVRRERVSAALDVVLADGMSWPTAAAADAVSHALRAPKRDVGQILAALARQGDARAHKTGETFVMYGRTMNRLVWRAVAEGEGVSELEEFRAWKRRQAAERQADEIDGREGLGDLLG